jgi:hypothetical protein
MKAPILQALKSSFIADSEKLKETNTFLTTMSRQQGTSINIQATV